MCHINFSNFSVLHPCMYMNHTEVDPKKGANFECLNRGTKIGFFQFVI